MRRACHMRNFRGLLQPTPPFAWPAAFLLCLLATSSARLTVAAPLPSVHPPLFPMYRHFAPPWLCLFLHSRSNLDRATTARLQRHTLLAAYLHLRCCSTTYLPTPFCHFA